MIPDCAQTVLHMLQYVPLVDPDGLVIPDQIAVGSCGLVKCYTSSCVDFTVSLKDLGPLDWAIHNGLMCFVSLFWIWCTLVVAFKHLIAAFACLFVT